MTTTAIALVALMSTASMILSVWAVLVYSDRLARLQEDYDAIIRRLDDRIDACNERFDVHHKDTAYPH